MPSAHRSLVRIHARTSRRTVLVSCELIEAEAELVTLAVGEQVLPRDFAPLEAGHAAEHATERGFNAGVDLVVHRTGDDACDEGALLVAIGELEVVEEGAVGGELAGARSGRCRNPDTPRH